MTLKAFAAKLFAKRIHTLTQKWATNPVIAQEKVFKELLTSAKETQFGKDHDFANIKTFQEFVKQVPIRDYEQLKPYVDRVVKGEENILWNGKPLYFAKTSGTTSGSKDILTRKSGFRRKKRNSVRPTFRNCSTFCSEIPSKKPNAQLGN